MDTVSTRSPVWSLTVVRRTLSSSTTRPVALVSIPPSGDVARTTTVDRVPAACSSSHALVGPCAESSPRPCPLSWAKKSGVMQSRARGRPAFGPLSTRASKDCQRTKQSAATLAGSWVSSGVEAGGEAVARGGPGGTFAAGGGPVVGGPALARAATSRIAEQAGPPPPSSSSAITITIILDARRDGGDSTDEPGEITPCRPASPGPGRGGRATGAPPCGPGSPVRTGA